MPLNWLVIVAGIVLLMPGLACAHNVGLECKQKGTTVHVEAYYDDDTPAAKAKVNVVDANDKIVASGVTDDKGLWSFPAPAAGKYEVRLDAGAGHRAKKAINVLAPPTKIEIPDSTGQTISEGADRAEFTSFPWLKVAIGLTVIGVLCAGFLIARALAGKSVQY